MWLAIGVGAFTMLFVVAAGLTLMYVLPRVSSKTNAPYEPGGPSVRQGDATPILQLESHTCGLLSLSAAYEIYGLSPDAKNLRFRLGVDRVAHPFDETSTGTLHPDLFRVLAQDQFRWTLIDPDAEDAATRLARHVDRGNVALLLIARRQNGRLHWVLTDGREGGALRIVDSLAAAPYPEPIDDFVGEFVLSIVALEPADRELPTSTAAHAEGLAEMARVSERMNAASERRP